MLKRSGPKGKSLQRVHGVSRSFRLVTKPKRSGPMAKRGASRYDSMDSIGRSIQPLERGVLRM
jgi:hypothetical protein